MGTRAASASWQGAAAAAAWPALGALFCAAYALRPAQFPVDTGQTLAFLAVAELPALFLGVVHAEAVGEHSRRGRYLSYAIGLVVLLLAGGLKFALAIETRFLLPMLGWVLVGHLVALWTGSDDPKLAHDRAWAVLYDKAALFALVPAAVVGTFLLALALHLAGLALGFDFDGWLSRALQSFDPAHLALLGTAYLGLSAISVAYAHGAGFAAHRRRLFDHPWVHFLTRSSRDSSH